MKKRVLIVDDSAIIARQLQKILDDSGVFEVVGHAKNGLEGLKLYSSLKPDIVCMDLIMPEMDGIQAIRMLMGIDKNAKIVVISSAGGVESKVVEALESGAKSVLTKPYEQDKVIAVMQQL